MQYYLAALGSVRGRRIRHEPPQDYDGTFAAISAARLPHVAKRILHRLPCTSFAPAARLRPEKIHRRVLVQ
jgi:hypothetical protein